VEVIIRGTEKRREEKRREEKRREEKRREEKKRVETPSSMVTREYLATIPTIDAHQHFWDPTTLRYDWLNPKTDHPFVGLLEPIAKPYLAADYLSDTKNQNIVKSVHLQAECSEVDYIETEWLEAQGLRVSFMFMFCIHILIFSSSSFSIQ